MKNYLLALCCWMAMTVSAQQTIEPNLKWGKPTQQELTMTEYAADKDADAVELFRDVDVYYVFVNGEFRVINSVRCRLKVLKPEGKRVADHEIGVRLSSSSSVPETVRGLKAVAYNMENGKVIKTKMETSMVHEEQVDKTEKLVKFSVPQVRVGTVIEYEYRLESDYYFQLRDWYAQSSIPVLYTKYSVRIPEWLVFHLEETGSMNLEKKEEYASMTIGEEHINTEERTFIGHNLPALKADDYVWCAKDYGCKVTHELQSVTIPGYVYKDYSSKWEDIDNTLFVDEEFGGRIKNSSPLKNELIAAGIPQIADTQERFDATWKLLHQRVRWNGDYAFWAKSGSKVLKEGTGTNADMNFLLINMLHDAGIEAEPVVLRLRNRGRLPLTHASLKYLSTFVVAVELNDSTTAFFDSSAEDGYLNVLPACLSVERARLIRKGKSKMGGWVNLQTVAQATTRSLIHGTLTEDGQLSGTITNALSGEAAAALRKRWRTAKDSTELIHQMQEDNDFTITDYQLQGRHDFSPNLREAITFTKQCTTADGIIYLNPLVLVPFSKNPFTEDTRNLPVELPFKQQKTINVVLNLPEGWKLEETAKPIVLKFDGITATIRCSQNGCQLSVLYKLNINRTLFTQQQYQDLKAFMEKLVENSKNIVTLTKTA